MKIDEADARVDRARDALARDPHEALELARAALDAGRERGGGAAEARALLVMGEAELRLGSRSEAEAHLTQALDVTGGDGALAAEAQLLLLRCAFLGQKGENALRHGHRALAIADGLGDAELRSRALNALGLVNGFMGAYSRALELLIEGERVREDHGLAAAGGPLNNMGNIFLLQDEPARALDSFERALAAFQREGNRQEEVIALGNIGRAFSALGQPARAREAHEQAVALAGEHAIVDYEAPALTKLGLAVLELGDPEAAREILDEALAIITGRSGAFRDETLAALAETCLRLGEHDEAEAYAREMMALAIRSDQPQMERDAHHLLSRVHEDAGDWMEALRHHKRYHDLRLKHDRDLFSGRTRALQLQHEVERAEREQVLLRARNQELTVAFDELQDLHEELRLQADELERMTLEDSLTGLHNRRSLQRRTLEERARVERYGGAYSLLVCDIDDFKTTNDRFSHAVGDQVLAAVGSIFRTLTRDVDVPARFGGEEFVVMMPATSADEATVVAEKIRRAVERHDWDALQPGLEVTVSIGVAQASRGASFEQVFSEADAQLYHAKRSGKNATRTAPPRASAG